MDLSTTHLKLLLAQLTRLPYTAKQDFYKLALETALIRADATSYLPEIRDATLYVAHTTTTAA